MSTISFLKGKRALITGASGRIGQAIANKLAQAGASVVLTGRNLESLKEAAANIKQNLTTDNNNVSDNPTVETFSCDVTDETSVKELFARIQGNDGQQIDILINNAGTNVDKPLSDLTANDFEWVMKVNVLGPFLCSREAFKHMSNGGRIINVGSLSAMSPRPDSTAYTTSKFALNGLSRSLALDGREHGVSVGIIHPGNVASDLLTREMIQARQQEGFVDANDVAECVLTMVAMPPTTGILELVVLPTTQPFVGRG
ncbi:1-acylglycerone phosphate reductase [Fistulifera solaris]|uniref:1-acylglycerone phosphate reductase n=1 Tax=Fistulifera solaris TaxID=1519565 RepID=A0A1Z5KQH7_FISSO|nr:1-acylglycerone phosphate reductase [Fistulifera solaris]|eukprot:GAX28556.1 1-acylglycerone phosphate reductase [Fistulifera solaris]